MHHSKLIGLNVLTQSRKKIGKIIGLIIDPESQSVLQYEVKKGFFGGLLLINRSQVLSLNEGGMVVEDLNVSEVVEEGDKVEKAEVKISVTGKDQAPALSTETEI